MKRLTFILLAAAMFLSCAVTAFATEDPLEIGVYAISEYTIDDEYTAPIEDGAASAAGVTVTDAPFNAVTLVIIPMTGEALEWIDGCAGGDAVAVYDIHFRDAEGNRINADGAKVSIAVSAADLAVSSVDTDGVAQTLVSAVSDGKVSFTTDGSPYYVLSEKKAGGEEPGEDVTVPGESEEPPRDPVVPPTGDETVIWPWMMTAMASTAMLFILAYRDRKQNPAAR
jgi:hypothetical protein